jgi:hypothetical protein
MSTISVSTTTTTAYKVAADTTGVLTIQTGSTPTTAVTIDGSGNVGVGVTPSAWAAGYRALDIGSVMSVVSGTGFSNLYNNTYNNGNLVYKSTGYATIYSQRQDTGQHQWYISSSGSSGATVSGLTQAMTLDASGNLLVGTNAINPTSGGMALLAIGAIQTSRGTTSTAGQMEFRNPNGVVGTIQTTGSVTAYNVSSDYRLKENIVPLTGALSTITQLKPSLYNYKADPSTNIEGFIAHELQAVVPHAVSGEKDAVDDDGNPIYQGVDASFLIPHLVAAIQEQQALITTLTERITALEAK